MPTHDAQSMVALRGDTARTRGRTLFSVLLSNRLSLTSSIRPPHRRDRGTIRWSLPAGLGRGEIGRLDARLDRHDRDLRRQSLTDWTKPGRH
jgi:hypothetical protein